jgi:hypothetical protein
MDIEEPLGLKMGKGWKGKKGEGAWSLNILLHARYGHQGVDRAASALSTARGQNFAYVSSALRYQSYNRCAFENHIPIYKLHHPT